MREIAAEIVAWARDGRPFAVATVVDSDGSAPRPVGTAMAVDADHRLLGNVSGGCVEAAVVEVADRTLRTGDAELVRYGISDEEGMAVGLLCGGTIDVLVQPATPQTWPFLDAVAASLRADEPVALGMVLTGPPTRGATLAVWRDRVEGTLGAGSLDDAVAEDARGMLQQGQTGVRTYGPAGQRRQNEVQVFVSSFAPPPRMLIFGATDFARALTTAAKLVGYRVTVCDAREVFATPARLPDADEIAVEWPHRYLERVGADAGTVICVLTHDPKFDVPLLDVALRTDAAYIGVMGSRRTHEDRMARLRALGVTDEQLARLASPIGLDLGARTAEETAISIMAEIIAARAGGTGMPLTTMDGPIHHAT